MSNSNCTSFVHEYRSPNISLLRAREENRERGEERGERKLRTNKLCINCKDILLFLVASASASASASVSVRLRDKGKKHRMLLFLFYLKCLTRPYFNFNV